MSGRSAVAPGAVAPGADALEPRAPGAGASRAPASEAFEVLLINPNTNAATTAMLARIAAEHLLATETAPVTRPEAPRIRSRIRIRAVAVATGPSVIVDEAELLAAEAAVLACARAEVRPTTVAVVVGAIGDPGLVLLRAAFAIPIVGIGEASARAAARGGRRFGIVTTTPLLAGSLHALGRRHSSAGAFTGVRLTDSSAVTLAGDPARQLRELERACLLCRETDDAEAVVIGGGPLGSSAQALATMLGMVVVQPVPAAIDEVLALLDGRAASGTDTGADADTSGDTSGDAGGDISADADAALDVFDVLDVL